MAEQLDLTTPFGGKANRTNGKIVSVLQEIDTNPPTNINEARIEVWMRFDNGERQQFVWTGQAAWDLMKIDNTRNYTTTSREKTLMNRIITDFPEYAGTVTGTVES